MTPQRAREVLQLLEAETSVRSIRAAFARRCRECHPDTAAQEVAFNAAVHAVGQVRGDPPPSVNELQQARDVLLSEVETQKRACKLCKGQGRVRGVMGWRSCSACDGEGDTSERFSRRTAYSRT